MGTSLKWTLQAFSEQFMKSNGMLTPRKFSKRSGRPGPKSIFQESCGKSGILRPDRTIQLKFLGNFNRSGGWQQTSHSSWMRYGQQIGIKDRRQNPLKRAARPVREG